MGCTSWPYHLQGPPAGGESLSMGVPATGTPMTPTVQFRLRIPWHRKPDYLQIGRQGAEVVVIAFRAHFESLNILVSSGFLQL